MKNPFSQTFTLAAASLTGHASNVTGASWTIGTATAGDGLAHHVTIRNDAAVDHSAKTITLSGVDADGNAISETLVAPGASAIVTSTKAFKSLGSAIPSATIGADTFDIGWAATGFTPFVECRNFGTASVAVFLESGTVNFGIQHCYTSDLKAFNAETGKTASAYHEYSAPVYAVRAAINSHTSGVITLQVLD
jgi:hypothetical protein